MKLDTEAIDMELRKLEGGFVSSLRSGFGRLSDIQGQISKNGALINEKHGEIKESGEKASEALREKASSVKDSVDAIAKADLAYLDRYKGFGQKDEEEQDGEDEKKSANPRRKKDQKQ